MGSGEGISVEEPASQPAKPINQSDGRRKTPEENKKEENKIDQ